MPSKALLAAAHAAAAARHAPRLGVHVGDVRVDFAAVMRHVHDSDRAHRAGRLPRAAARGRRVAVAHGDVALHRPAEREVDGEPVRLRARRCWPPAPPPACPGIPGLAEAAPLTSDDVWDLTELPGRLLVLGGGPIGCELGQAFARLGSRVSVVEAGPRVLGPEDAARGRPGRGGAARRRRRPAGGRLARAGRGHLRRPGRAPLRRHRACTSTGCWSPSVAPPGTRRPGTAGRRGRGARDAATWSSTARCAPPTPASGPPAT